MTCVGPIERTAIHNVVPPLKTMTSIVPISKVKNTLRSSFMVILIGGWRVDKSMHTQKG